MKYLFLGSFCEQDEESVLLSWSKVGLQSSIINFQRNMIQGLKGIIAAGDSVDVINYYPLGTWPRQCNRIMIRHESRSGYYRMALINIPIVKQVFYNIQAKLLIANWIRRNKDEKVCLVTYDMLRPYLKSLSAIPKSPKLMKATIVADLLNEYGYNKNEHGIKGFLKTKIGYDSMKRVKSLDFCGLLTKQMAIPLEIEQEKYVVIEGFSDKTRYYKALENNDRVILFYGGVLSKEYQINILLDAFCEIQSDKFELWLCGSGQYVPNIIERAKADDRIKYLGYKTHEEIAILQSLASILINPRQNIGEYTKYSFPSKIIEYLSTARPIIAYRLDGISDCYYDYIFYPDDNSVESLKKTILNVAQLSHQELMDRGLAGRNFVLARTEPSVQMAKIITGMQGGLQEESGGNV